MTRVAIVSLGRSGAKGEVRRVTSWRLLFEAVGASVSEISLTRGRRPHLDGIVSIAAGRAMPERLAWSGRRLRAELEAVQPDLVVAVSARAFDPVATTGSWDVVVDLVDDLARSYRDRADLATNPLAHGSYRALAAAHQRVGHRVRRGRSARRGRGWTDARHLDVEWIPIVCDPALRPTPSEAPDRDVLFFGTLRYAPNIDALERLGRIWPLVLDRRPGTTALIAGSAPTCRVRELCVTHAWELLPDFPSLPAVAARARLAVVPLDRTAGIQIKVLDAVCLGIAQVVTPAASRATRRTSHSCPATRKPCSPRKSCDCSNTVRNRAARPGDVAPRAGPLLGGRMDAVDARPLVGGSLVQQRPLQRQRAIVCSRCCRTSVQPASVSAATAHNAARATLPAPSRIPVSTINSGHRQQS